MTLEDAILANDDIDVVCSACGAVTALNPRFFVLCYGTSVPLEALARRLLCMGCGGAHVTVTPPQAASLDVRVSA